MQNQRIYTTTAAEQDRCIDLMTLAFSGDPGVRWMYPDPQQYLINFPKFARIFGGKAFEHNTAQYLDDFRAVALWIPPGAHPDEEAMVELIQTSVQPELLDSVFEVFTKMDAYHPNEPHWHLPLLGTDPNQQRKSYGTALLRHHLTVCDQQHLPAYLEATNPMNVALYLRHGFKVLGDIQAGTSPTITPMLREPTESASIDS